MEENKKNYYSQKFNITIEEIFNLFVLRVVNRRLNNLRKKDTKFKLFAIFNNDKISQHINFQNSYESKELETIFGFLKKNIRNFKKKVCIDVGANLGTHSIYFSNYFKKVIAFEPNKETFYLLKFNTKNIRNIKLINKGLFFKKLNSKLYVPSFNLGGSSLKNRSSTKKKIQKAKFVDFDSLKLDKNIGMIKLDTEGTEFEILKGMNKTITKKKPIIIFEQLSSEFKNGFSKSIRFLKKKNYVFFIFNENPDRIYLLSILIKIYTYFFGEKKKLSQVQGKFKKRDYKIILGINKNYLRNI